ncbi:MAG: symmetrical bis(5'-nucleosyl)-tetraphosphatase [Proteobacteria bacterium]|nr:symmetrical bis(5'-nucleosyl)-tetraphosphatase [Pseudomonadota bacterium]
MATYVIGDVQGCLPPLKQLLHQLQYDPKHDQLWFTGDIVNRGLHSLETIRFIRDLPESTIVVLGNHDFGLLAIEQGCVPLHGKDTLQPILEAPDCRALCDWLRHRPLMHHDPKTGFTLTHAGIYPLWDLSQAQQYAKEIEQLLQDSHFKNFLQHLYGEHALVWEEKLTNWNRARFITSAFTRMRFCTAQGALDLTAKGSPVLHPELIPWFSFPDRRTQENKLIFGHWAALPIELQIRGIYPLDSGCVWGNSLTAFCLQTEKKITVDCKDYIKLPFF